MKTRLSGLVERAAQGETIRITDRGKLKAELGPLSVSEWGDRWMKARLARVPPLWNAESEWRQVELHALEVLVEGKRFGQTAQSLSGVV